MTLAYNVASVLWAAISDSTRSGDLGGSRAAVPVRDPAAIEMERSLAQRVRAGEPNAFRTLMEMYFPLATRLANTIVHEQDLAEDIAQGVFSNIWERREQWDPRVSIRAYILGAVRNRALDVIKHRDVGARYAALEIVDTTSDLHPDDRLDRLTQLTALHAAILDLPERRRMALTLRFDMELSYPEVGAALGISANGAKELIVRTVETLRIQLRNFR